MIVEEEIWSKIQLHLGLQAVVSICSVEKSEVHEFLSFFDAEVFWSKRDSYG